MVRGRRFWLIAAVLLAAVAAVYGGTYRHEFLNYDDNLYITDNPAVTNGLSVDGVRWAFGFHAGNWHPLTWISHMLDAQLFGTWAGGHHLVSAGLHAANAVLLFALLAAATGSFWRSAAVAAIFALHPLRVESVAWAAERKDVLSALFWFLTLIAYVRYAQRPGTGRFLCALSLFALGLAAKPMLVTLPFVLLLLDWWPLGRAARAGGASGARPASALVAEKLPFLLLSLASSLVTLWVQTTSLRPLVRPDALTRLANGAVSYLQYLRTFAWPARLAPLYPYPREGLPPALAAAALVLLLAALWAAWRLRRSRPFLLTGWLWYLGTLVPVIGVVQIGAQARDDRYTYLTLVGVAIALVWLAAAWWPRRAGARSALAAAALVWIATLAVASAGYTRLWRDNLTLYEHTIRVTPDNPVILNNLGIALSEARRYDEAQLALAEAVRLAPELCDAHYTLGLARFLAGDFPQAAPAFARALDCYAEQGAPLAHIADTHLNLGETYRRLQRWVEAERHYLALLRLRPDDSRARVGLAIALRRQGRE